MLFAHQLECEQFASAVLMEINTTQNHESIYALTLVTERDHAMLPPTNRKLSKYCKGLPLVQIDVVDADVIERDVSSALKHPIIPATVHNE